MSVSLRNLDNHPDIWRATSWRDDMARLQSGFSELDCALNGGIVSAGVVRVNSNMGIGEVSLFKKVLQHRPHKSIFIINAAGVINGAWATGTSIPPQRLIQVKTRNYAETIWATEQCLKSDAVHCVLCWLPEINEKHARRLQVAASGHNTLLLLMMPLVAASFPLPISQDMLITRCKHMLRIDIKKQRSGWPVNGIEVELLHTPTNAVIRSVMREFSLNSNELISAG